jgi:membrane protein YqaA with SNARE-associated domain
MGLTVPTNLIALVWGFGEATLFFIVPDVGLTLVAVRSPRAAIVAWGWSVVGGVFGGLLMYLWGRADPPAASAAIAGVPAISTAMIARVHSSLQVTGLRALFLGPITGAPYKIYAVASGSLRLDWLAFLLISVPARGLRSLMSTAVASWLGRVPLATWPERGRRVLVIGLWIVIYVIYFRR